MDKTMKRIFLPVVVTLLFSTVIFAEKINLHFDICFNSLSVEAVNNSNFDYIPPFKRGVSTIFLISTEFGRLFENKYWKLSPADSIPKTIKSLPRNRSDMPMAIALTPQDLSHYMPLDKSFPFPTDFPRLFVKALIKNPGEKADSFISTSIHELIINDKRISEVKEISEESVPNEVKSAFEKEIEKIALEENSPEYGYW